MSGWLDWLDAQVEDIERMFSEAWDSLVLAEQRHPIILALATFIVLSFFLSLLCNLCCWCCGLCRQRQPGVIYVPANYGTMGYPQQNFAKQPLVQDPNQPVPSTSKQQPYAPFKV